MIVTRGETRGRSSGANTISNDMLQQLLEDIIAGQSDTRDTPYQPQTVAASY